MNDAWQILVPALATALLQFLWQGALAGLLAWLALALLRNASAQARYAVACSALLACVLLPAWSLVQALARTHAPAASSLPNLTDELLGAMSTTPGATLRVLTVPSAEALPWVVALWAAGVLLLSLRMGAGLLWVRGLCRASDAEPSGHWQACVDRLAPRLGLARAVSLRLTHAGHGPITAGWWRPVVLMPFAVVMRLPADLVEALIAHELAHVRRHDYLVNLLQGAAEALLFYHPVVWWLSRRIRVERELVADDLAATALGDRRRLALALAELDRHVPHIPDRSPLSLPHYAPAAHGGHLMSRIKQLIRPERRSLGGAVVLPLIGLAVAGATFYANARLTTPAPQAAPVATAKALPVPTAKSGVQVLAAAPSQSRGRHETFALIEQDSDGITMSGNVDDVDEIQAARDRLGGDFVWFRRDGKAWVVRDPQIMARIRKTWEATQALEAKMEALEATMEPHEDRMEALSERLESMSEHHVAQSPEAEAATEKMEALGAKMEELAERQVALAERMGSADEAAMARLEAERDKLEGERESIEQQMEDHSRTLKALNARIEAQTEPMEALGREMEAASKPMEAIGREMEVLGKRLEKESELADAQARQVLDEAYRSGPATPASVER